MPRVRFLLPLPRKPQRLLFIYYFTLFQIGPVVQLVRTLACHARGRRFEPDPGRQFAAIAQQVERILGKDEVSSPNLLSSSRKPCNQKIARFFCRIVLLCIIGIVAILHRWELTANQIMVYYRW